MPNIDETELKRQLKEGQLAPLYLIYGDEAYLKKIYTYKLIKKLTGSTDDEYKLRRFEGESFDLELFLDELEAFPFMGGSKCLLIHDLNIMDLPAEGWERLKPALEDIPDYCRVIFWLDSVPLSKQPRSKSLLSLASKQGCAVELGRPDKAKLSKTLRDGAARRGCELSSEMASYIIFELGQDMQTLLTEMEKICAYAGGGAITKAHVDAVAVKSIDAKGYDMAKAIIKNDFQTAFKLIDQLFYLRTEPTMILAAITGSFGDIYRAKCASTAGEPMETLSQAFPAAYKGREFKLRYAVKDGARLSLQSLRESMNALYQADVRLKSSRAGDRIVIEELISKLLLIAARS
ncbi:MAG: DNA polymerase III subunit delta [Oscillospiraceae bacterium]|jgi:DNA polymerase-3 subunit delta|nr:DNA polymerase III subunit delta [Oscillospiraceae bacterium]